MHDAKPMRSRPRPERWRLAGWLGGVLAAEWEACGHVAFTSNAEVLVFGAEDASAPSRVSESAMMRRWLRRHRMKMMRQRSLLVKNLASRGRTLITGRC
jgi:hypothetical protein